MKCFALLVGLLAVGCDEVATSPEGGGPPDEGGNGQGGSTISGQPIGGAGDPGPTAEITSTITAATWIAKCGEPIPLDNMSGSVTVEYENVSDVSGWIMLTQGDLVFPLGEGSASFAVLLGNNYTGGLDPGEISTQVHESQPTEDHDTRAICDFCNQKGEVRLVYELENPVPQTASFEIQLLCIP